MTRRRSISAILSAAAAASGIARADAANDAHNVIAVMAGSLAEDDFASFAQCLKRGVPALDELAANVRALLAEYRFTTSVRPIANTGSDTERSLELDWYVELKTRALDLNLIRRQATVTCTVAKEKKRWLVTAMASGDLFAIPQK